MVGLASVTVSLLAASCGFTSAEWTFNIFVERFGGVECEALQIGDKDFFMQDECKSRGDAPAFAGFRHYWGFHTGWEVEEISKYGACSIHAWTGKDCDGHYIGKVDEVGSLRCSPLKSADVLLKANSYARLGWCHGIGLTGEEARSLKVTCD